MRISDWSSDVCSSDLVFWQAFGNVLKEGVVEDTGNRERILKLLRFPSTLSNTADERVSLDAYIARIKPEHKAIYYLTADGRKDRNRKRLNSSHYCASLLPTHACKKKTLLQPHDDSNI